MGLFAGIQGEVLARIPLGQMGLEVLQLLKVLKAEFRSLVWDWGGALDWVLIPQQNQA